MEDDAFRDYCKAENSDDEEANRDLQSQLYAKIYYESNDVDSVDIKPRIKFEPPNADNEELCNKADSSRTFSDNALKDVTKSYENNYITTNPALTKEDNKFNFKFTCGGNQTEISDKDSKNNSNVLYTLKHPQENVISQGGKGSTSQKVEVNDGSISSNTNGDVSIKPEAKESEVELETTNSTFEINESATGSHLISSNSCVDSTGENIQEEELSCVRHDVHYDNIIKRYEFSKVFINELYQQKYEQLQTELLRLEEAEREREVKKKEEESTSNIRINSITETETYSKYNVHTKNEKQWKATDFYEDEIMLSSDTETDSELSILEVPIPPKPQPPVINLEDPDDSDVLSSDNDTDDCSFIIEEETSKKVSHTSLRRTNSSKDRYITEDIVLNCSEVQKSASSITEIKEMSKNVQNKSGECYNKNKNDSEKEKSALTSKRCNKNLNETGKSLSSSETDNIPEFRVPALPSSSRNVVFKDKDKDKSVTSMEDVTNFEISHQPSSSRKRHIENDNECSVNAKQRKQSCSKDTPSEVCIDQHGDKDNTETVWKDYFFRPMSEKIKAFYNESRGQENFNVQAIQSKMSKDPRMWAILDEDLMPNFARRRRFWNVKCNNCNDVGHQTYHCTLPRKPPRCYMCGTQGHTETRCPQKMCLTCGKKQGTFRKTCEFCRTLYCDMCRAIGHKSTECPDHWRRFHQTTQNSEIHIPENLSEVMKPADLLYCCNCTRRGHDSSTCHDYRWSQHFPTPAFVTNYMEESQNETRRNTASEDMISLSNHKPKTRNIIIPEGIGDIPNASVLYKYGSFQTSVPNGQILQQELEHQMYFRADNFLKNLFPPLFMNELVKIAPFDIVIFRTPNKALFLRTRGFAGVVAHVHQIIIYWLKLNLEDKRLLQVNVNIPRDDAGKLLNIFCSKWDEMLRTSGDPQVLANEIKTLKSTLKKITDPSISQFTTDRILNLRSKLLNLYNVRVTNWLGIINRITSKVKRILRTEKKVYALSDKLYVRCIHIYNEIFLPRTLTEKELKLLIAKIKKKPKVDQNLKKKLDPYEKFIRRFQQNTIPKTQKKVEKQNPKKSSTISPNILQGQCEKIPICASTASITHEPNKNQEQNKRLPACTTTGNAIQEQSKMLATCISTENVCQEQMKRTSVCTSNKNIIQELSSKIATLVSNENVTQQQNKKVPICTSTETISTCNTVSESKAVYPTETVQLQRNNDTSTNDKVKNTINQNQEKILQPNIINMPMVEIKDTTCTLIQSNDNNSEENRGTIKNNNAPATSSSQQEHTAISEIAVTKKKKRKRKKTSESNTEGSTDVSIESKAEKVINQALEFKLPYMNQAVEEVKKRINDKNIKQEHIDVLQRLINLERDHQQYVSSFCSYLK